MLHKDFFLFLFLDPFTRLQCEEKACFLSFHPRALQYHPRSSKGTQYSDFTVADVAHLPSLVPAQQHNSPPASGSTLDLQLLLLGGFFLLLGP